MSSTHSARKRNLRPLSKAEKGAEEGRKYEETLTAALATRAHELSKHKNPKFREFVLCREVKIGKYRKFDDIVLSYADQDNSKKLIFVQVKHKQDSKLIKSGILSAEAARAKDIKGPYGYMCEAFNLQKYFISYVSVRDELKRTDTQELKGGEIKYVVIFTNVGLDCNELGEKGFILKKAPDDVVNLFTFSSDAQHPDHFYQLEDVSEGSRKVLKESSDLVRIARELAQYAVGKNHRKNEIMGYVGTPLEHYHSFLENYVIKIKDKVYAMKLMEKHKIKKRKFREAQFRDEFLKSTAENLQTLRNALLGAMREIDKSKKGVNEDDLKKDLKAAKWKIVPSFGSSLQNIKTDLPCEWISVGDGDISGFLQRFVWIANQPKVGELDLLCKHFIQGVAVENTSLKPFQDQIYATGEEFKKLVRIKKPHNDEKWISSVPIGRFYEERSQRVDITYDVAALTRMYKKDVMHYGKFNEGGKKLENVDSFLASDCKILCVNTPVTLLSSIKLLQHLNAMNDLISVSLDVLNCAENRDSVLKAFRLEGVNLLVIECRHAFKGYDINEFVKIAKTNSNKKIILIMQPENDGICMKYFKTDFQGEGICVVESDSVDFKDFEPRENPLLKSVFLFQGQKVSLSDITGFDNWNSFVDYFCQGTNEHDTISKEQMIGMTLIEILSKDKIEVGSKPEGTSSLEGAFAKIYDKIDVETLVNRLTSQEHDNDTNDIYIFSGITGSSKEHKIYELIQSLARDIENAELKNDLEELKNRLKTASVTNLKVFDDSFKVKNFREICHSHPEKCIFWICANEGNDVTTFTLQEMYNPKFYLKRKFKNVIIKKDLKEHLIKDDLSEMFIFHCEEDKQELYNSMELNAREVEQFEKSCMIKIRTQKSDAEAEFECFKKKETVHLLEFVKKQFVWCKSHGSEKTLQKYIDYESGGTSLIEEDTLIAKIKDRKVVIFADDPGMGKTTTLIKLYETEIESSSIIKSHWVIGIKLKLRDHLEAVRDLVRDGISVVRVVELLSKIDSKLNNNLAKIVLKIALDKSGNFQTKPLLLVLDGFDEVLNEEDRNCVLQLLKFIKNKTAAKLWITTRCHFKKLLEEELSAVAIQFSPLDDAQKAHSITTYLQHRLYLLLNEEKYTELFGKDDKKQNNKKIHMYAAVFINKMKSIFRGDIATFIGTPLQLYLMLEDSARHFKKCMENDDIEIPNLNYLGNNVFEIYEHFIKKKYGVYFHKDIEAIKGIEGLLQELECSNLDQRHKTFAISKFFEENTDDGFERFKDIFLLVGVIQSQGSDLEFIHKTFEEFFASKVFLDWIRKAPSTNEQEYLLKVILMKPDYPLVRTFMNLQLQKLSEQGLNERDKSLENYGNVAAELLNQENSPLIHEDSKTPLHIAVQEGNEHIVYFLLNILKEHPDVLRKFLFTPNADNLTALHLACMREDIGTVKALLDAAAGISKETLQEFLKFGALCNVFEIAKMHNKSVEICKELLSRANDKLDLVLLSSMRSALCTACLHKRENFVEFLLQEFEHDTHSLKKLLLYNDVCGNALGCAKSTTTVEKLISAAKSVKDGNETLKKLLLPDERNKPFHCIISDAEFDVVHKVLEVAKKTDEDTLKQLLLNKRTGISALHVAAKNGRVDIIKLLLKTASDLGIDMLEKLITAVDEKRKTAIQLMFEHGHETIFDDSFKMLEGDKYKNILEKVTKMLDNERLKSRLCSDKKNLIRAIELDDIKKVKDILSKVKSSCVNSNERLRISLLDDKYFKGNILHIACERGNSDIIKELLSYAKEIDHDNNTLKELIFKVTYGVSALHVAAKKSHVDVIKLLLKTAADLGVDLLEKLIYAVDEEGKNTIQSMVERFHVKGTGTIIADFLKIFEEEKYIKSRKKVMEMLDNEPLKSMLHFFKEKLIRAIERGNTLEVKDILSKVKSFSVNGNESLRILLTTRLEKHIFLNNRRYIACSGQYALHVAAENGHFDITKLLLETASAVGTDEDNKTLKQLLLTEICGKSPLHVAVERGHVDVTKLLLETASAVGIDDDNYTLKQLLLCMKDIFGYSTLHVAIERGHVDVTKLLLETASAVGIDDDNYTLKQLLLYMKDIFGYSTLHVAAGRGHVDITKLLLETASAAGIDDDNPILKQLLWNDRSGVSALHVAAARCYGGDIVRLLLETTASALGIEMMEKLIFAVNEEGKNAIQVVAELDHSDFTKLLLQTVCAEGIKDDNRTLKHLLLNDRFGESVLRFATKRCGGDFVKQLLETTASALGIEMLEKLIFAVNEEGKNAIQLLVDRGHEVIFADSFIMLEEEYPDTWEKIKDNLPLENRLYLEKVMLIRGRDVSQSQTPCGG